MFEHHFSKKVVKNLHKRGISIIGICSIPDFSTSMPYANADTGYELNDNGCHRIRRYFEVIKMSETSIETK